MTQNTSRSSHLDPSSRLRAHDPAELLALARLQLHLVPHDSIVLIGHTDRRSTAVSLRLDLPMVTADDHGRRLEEVFDMLRAEGATGAFALVVLGDGYHEDPGGPAGEEPPEQIAAMIAARILMASLSMLPEEFDVPEVWILGGGRARPVLLRRVGEQDGPETPFDLATGPEQELPAISSTLIAADAVLAGRHVPDGEDTAPGAWHEHRATILDAPVRRPALPLPLAWSRACTAMGRLDSRTLSGPDGVTACEQLADLLDALVGEDRGEAFLSLLTGVEERVLGDSLMALLEDPRTHPLASIRPGGKRFESLDRLVRVLEPAPDEDASLGRWSGWANAAAVLSVLEWWNLRYARGGDLADAIVLRDPGNPLARCAAQLTAIPITPCWRRGGR